MHEGAYAKLACDLARTLKIKMKRLNKIQKKAGMNE